MRVLLHDRTGVPFTVQLGRELAERGYDVLYSYGAFFQSPKGDLARRETDSPHLQIVGMELSEPFQKYSFIRRRFQEIEYARDLVEQIKAYGPDVVILAGSHPDALGVVYKEIAGMGVQVVFWVQDLYGIAIERFLGKKLPFLGHLVGKYYVWKERRLIEQSDDVILITEDFIPLMEEWGIDQEKVHVIHNWTPLEEVPVCPKDNEWAREHGLVDKFCILYAGTLGLKHNPQLLLDLALHFEDEGEVEVVVVSEGLGADWLREKQRRLGVRNLRLLDFQPFNQMPFVMGAADVLVAILEPDAGIYSAPSKVLTYLCAERALLLAVPPENLSARIVAENGAGLVVPPVDSDSFVEAAERLFADGDLRESCAKNARSYAERAFDIKKIGDHFEEIFCSSERCGT